MPIDRSDEKVQILFMGFFISHINAGAPFADIGALANSPCHSPRVKIFKSSKGQLHELQRASFDVGQDIEIKVENTTRTTIDEFRTQGFDRKNANSDPNDFGWVVDLNSEIFGGVAFPLINGTLKPIIRVNSAVFYTVLTTDNPLRIKRPNQAAQDFGKIAEHFAAKIAFDKPDTRVVVRNGINEVLTIDQSEPDARYLITIDCHCQQDVAVSDFPEVFKVFADVPATATADFQPTPVAGALGGISNGGDVPCGGGNLKP